MKVFLGLFLIVAGIAVGFYVGLWLMFVGGIIQVVNAIKAAPVESTMLAWGVVKIFFAGAVGGICGLVVGGVGVYLVRGK